MEVGGRASQDFSATLFFFVPGKNRAKAQLHRAFPTALRTWIRCLCFSKAQHTFASPTCFFPAQGKVQGKKELCVLPFFITDLFSIQRENQTPNINTFSKKNPTLTSAQHKTELHLHSL
jgi:hypothetical protein